MLAAALSALLAGVVAPTTPAPDPNRLVPVYTIPRGEVPTEIGPLPTRPRP